MTAQIITISKSLWVDLEGLENDGLFYLRDDTGGNTLIDHEEIPALIQVLTSIEKPKTAEEEVTR